MSHRMQTYDTQHGAFRTGGATMPRAVRSQTATQNARQPTTTRSSAATTSPSESSHFVTEFPSNSGVKLRSSPAGTPRLQATISTVRPTAPLRNAPGSHLLKPSSEAANPVTEEVPLVMESGERRILHQRYTTRRTVASSDISSDGRKAPSPLDMAPDAIFGVVMPRTGASSRPTEFPPRLIPELQALAATPTRRPEAFNKSGSSISSPSTRLSSSPWSVTTTTTTPTSWSSASPTILQPLPVKDAGARSQTVPTSTLNREKPPKVPAIPDALPQARRSECSSGVNGMRRPASTKRTPPNAPAPMPPPRTSSTKRAGFNTSSRSEQRGTPEYEVTTLSSGIERAPLSTRTQKYPENVEESLLQAPLAKAHDNLQESLGGIPPPPGQRSMKTEDGTTSMERFEHPSTTRSQEKAPMDSAGERGPKPAVAGTHEEGYNLRPGTNSQTPQPRPCKSSRLGIFSRKGKSPAPEPGATTRKLRLKGPAAGTGHEGYAKHGRRGREPSEDSRSTSQSESERSVSSTRRIPFFSSKGTTNSRSSSRQDRTSQSDLDDFVSTRLKPVPIIGGSGVTIDGRSGRGLDVYGSAQEPTSPTGGRTIPQSQISFNQQSLRASPSGIRDPSPCLKNGPSLAIRRSQRFRQDGESFSLRTPIRTDKLSGPLRISSQDECRSPTPLRSFSTSSATTEPHRGNPSLPKSEDKRSWKLRWNVFRRKDAEEDAEEAACPPTSSADPLPVNISSIPAPRSMPYYAMIDSESEMNSPEQLSIFLPQRTGSPAAGVIAESYEGGNSCYGQVSEAHDDHILPPRASPSLTHSFNSLPLLLPVPLQSPTQTQRVDAEMGQSPQRQPRLARVGRIPAVVPRNEGRHRPSRASFSQPFARDAIAGNAYNLQDMSGPGPGVPQQSRPPLQPSQPPSMVDHPLPTGASTMGNTEFLHFTAAAASEASSSSASEGSLRILDPPLVPGLPKPSDLRRPTRDSNLHVPNSPSVDEVWNEYDDFIDHVMSPSLASKGTISRGKDNAPFSEQADRRLPPSKPKPLKPQAEDGNDFFRNLSAPAADRPLIPQATATFPMSPADTRAPSTTRDDTLEEDIRLRRSRIVSALHSSTEPASPFSIRDLLNDYDSQQNNSTKSSGRISASSNSQPVESSGAATMNEAPAHSNPIHQEHVTLLDVVERNKDPAAQSEHQFASLMVAKWLSFGRVLFSPAHEEIQTLRERHILIIDGLGNEDWSLYCAFTYEGQQAFVHHLKEHPSASGSKGFRSAQNSPGNYRRAQVASFYEHFPFPPTFFSAIVLRFPPAMAEAKLKNIISECRRVLLPGGYLELLLLDLDIVNMGVQTRRAIRELKFRMTTADRQISLRPIIDNVQGILGARGFSNISRCTVGVPVVGRPATSAESSSSSRSSGGSDSLAERSSGSPRLATASPRMTFGHSRTGTNLSLNDLIADRSDNADAKIGKIVSRTGRAWWLRCFEASVISEGNLSGSILANKDILRECRSRGSSFKMLIAHAQRPVFERRRRTMSEPIVPTLATAGAQRRA